jgi:FkbM family methyltransferase
MGQLARAKQRSSDLSRLLRRSGVAVAGVADYLDWTADHVYQIGVGTNQHEVIVMLELWPDVQFTGYEPYYKLFMERLTGKGVNFPSKYRNIEGRKYGPEYPGDLYNLAIGKKEGVANLYIPARHPDGAALTKPLKEDQKFATQEVTVAALDDLWPNGPKGEHVLLWVDCEGSELDALQGGEKFVEKVEFINIEMTSNPSIEGEADPVELHEWLSDHGFYRQWVHTLRFHCGQTDCIYVRPHLFQEKYCNCPFTMREFRQREKRDES